MGQGQVKERWPMPQGETGQVGTQSPSRPQESGERHAADLFSGRYGLVCAFLIMPALVYQVRGRFQMREFVSDILL